VAYEIKTIGDVAGDPDPAPLAAQAASVSGPSNLTSIATGLARDVVAQRTGLLVGLAVGAAGALLYVHMRR
jgi:hypothetical protein